MGQAAHVRSWLIFPFFPFWNAGERRLRAALRVVTALVVIGLLSGGLHWAFARATHGFAGIDAALASASLFVLWPVLSIVLLWGVSRFVDRRPLHELGLRLDLRWAEDAAFGIALGGVLMSGILGVEIAFGLARYGEPAAHGDVPRMAHVSVAALAFVAVAINEELLFRGNQIKNLAEGLSSRWIPPAYAPLGAVLLSSIVFGVAHVLNPEASAVSTGNIALAGLMLAAGYLTTGRLGIAIGLHFSWNFFQNLYGMPVSGQTRFFTGALLLRHEAGPDWITGGGFGPEAGLTGLCAMLAGTLLTLGWVRARYGPLRMDASIAALPPRVRAGLPAPAERPAAAIEDQEPA